MNEREAVEARARAEKFWKKWKHGRQVAGFWSENQICDYGNDFSLAENAEQIAEKARWQQQMQSEVTAAHKRAEASEAEVVKLREAMRVYGIHKKNCNFYRNDPCNCGFESALNPGAAKGEV